MKIEVKRLFDLPYYQLANKPLDKCITTKYKGKWVSESTQSFIDKFNILSKGLLEIGVKKGDKIVLISTNNRTEWHLFDMAIQQIGAIVVPVYPTISVADYEYIFNNAEVSLCFVSDAGLLKKVLPLVEKVPTLREIYSFDTLENCKSFEELMEIGAKSNRDGEVKELSDAIQTDDMATIIYTSGTTGNPKGVMLSHKNIISNTVNSLERIPSDIKSGLSFLPTCHVYERMIIYSYMILSIEIYFAEGLERIADNAREIQPEMMTVVPRLVERVYERIVSKGKELEGVKYKLFFWAVDLAEKYEPFKKMNPFYTAQLNIARKIVFSKWKAALGGKVRLMISGSAPAQTRLIRIFNAAEIPLVEGYGMTETSPVIAVNDLKDELFELGTVGKPIRNLEVKFAEDGEILVKGDSVMIGYYKMPEETKAAFDADGFFHTGDIGIFTPKGMLKLTDRKKEMFKNSGGKYVAPQVIENQLKTSKFIEQAMVVGNGEKLVAAFIQLDFEFVNSWLKYKNIEADTSSLKAITENKEVSERIKRIVTEVNKNLGSWEQVKKFTLVPEVWTIDKGLLTPTMKLKRKVILERYSAEYEKMFGR